MRAVTFQAPGEVRVGTVSDPVLREPTDAIVRVTLSAVCGSDLHIYNGRFPRVPPGAILGHEFLGRVEEVGSDVTRVSPGMRVVASFFSWCGTCAACLAGQMSQCQHLETFGFGQLAGAQAERVRVPRADTTLVPVPDALPDEAAVMAGDILSTAFFAAERAGIRPGDTVAVVGAGPVGLLAIQCAALYSPVAILALDRVDERLRLAASFGARPVPADVDATAAVRSYTAGKGASAVIEAVGSRESLNLAIALAAPFGTVSAAGVFAERDLPVDMARLFNRDLTLRSGLGNVPAVIGRVMALTVAGRLQPQRIVSHRMPLDEAEEAYRRFDRREALKILLMP